MHHFKFLLFVLVAGLIAFMAAAQGHAAQLVSLFGASVGSAIWTYGAKMRYGWNPGLFRLPASLLGLLGLLFGAILVSEAEFPYDFLNYIAFFYAAGAYHWYLNRKFKQATASTTPGNSDVSD